LLLTWQKLLNAASFLKENKLEAKSAGQVLFYANATVQLSAFFAFQYLGLIWPFYIIIGGISFIIAIQTLAAALAFSGVGLNGEVRVANTGGINILLSILYLVSSYHIYLIGFVGFAWIAGTHSVIHLLTNILGASKNDSSSVHPDEK
jgi:hypothetical protein